MGDRMGSQDMDDLAARIAREIINRMGNCCEDSVSRASVSLCGAPFSQCGTYNCSATFECSRDFKCTSKYSIVKVPAQITGGCGGGHAFSECGEYTCPKEFRCESAKFICTATFKDSPTVADLP